MPFNIYHLFLLTSFILSSTAFRVSFYEDQGCAGAFEGTWIGGRGQGCRHDFVGTAEGALVESTGAVDDGTVVRFYSSKNCAPGTMISESNSGCAAVDSEIVGAYRSFEVVADVSAGPIGKKRRSTRERRRPLNVAPPSPSALEVSLTHGQKATFDGIEYRWQQVHATGFVGILPEQWDDMVHVMDDTVFPDLANYTSSLEDRSLYTALCRTATTCVKGVRSGSVTVWDAVSPWAYAALKPAANKGIALNTFLNENPFIAQLVASSIGGVVASGVTYIWAGGKTSGNNKNINECSTEKSQVDALISIIQSQNLAKHSGSMTVKTLMNDPGEEVSSISFSTIACGETPSGDGCGVTQGFCPVPS